MGYGDQRNYELPIEGDPVAEPAEIRNVRLVFKEGVGYDPAPLNRAVEEQTGIR